MTSPPLEGRFHGAHHLALLAHLERSGVSGMLAIRTDLRKAWISFLGGHITWAETDDPTTTAGRVLVDAGVVRADQLRTLEAGAPDEDTLMERVSEVLGKPRSDLEPWRLAAVRARLAAGVGWGSGTWTFSPVDGAQLDGIDPRLLPDLDLVRIGWDAVVAWIDEGRARREVLDPTGGPLLPGPDLDRALAKLRLPQSLSELGARIRSQVEPATLMAELGGSAPELVRVLWLLEHGGWVVRRDRGPIQPDASGTPPEPVARQTPEVPPDHVEAARALALWEIRNECDLYELLGVRPYASTASVERAARSLLTDLSKVSRDASLPDSARTIARNLLAAAQVARATLTDEGRRTDYDAERKKGTARTVARLLSELSPEGTGSSGPTRTIHVALQQLADNQLEAAAVTAQRACFLEPDDPDVLAEAAWVLWCARHVAKPEPAPDDLVLRALARHPGHVRAREVRDQIATQRAAGEGTRQTLLGWLRSRS